MHRKGTEGEQKKTIRNNKNDKYKKKTEIQTQRQIQRQTHTHRYGKIPNTQSRKDPNAKSQMFLLRLPAFGGQSCLRDQMISRLPEVRFKV